jgi:hypothetical protein
MSRRRWDLCIHHDRRDCQRFVREYFAETHRQVLFVAAAGFDARSTCLAELLHAVAGGRVRGIFFREERPDPHSELNERAARHEQQLTQWFPGCTVLRVDVFDAADQAVVAGSRTVRALEGACALDGITDVVIDMSALSIGVSFPMVRYLFQRAHRQSSGQKRVNVHAILVSDASMDEGLEREFMDNASIVKGFDGTLRLTSQREKTTRLWIPQLSHGKREALRRMYKYLEEQAPLLDVCPLLPFPGKNPRRADELVVEYRAELEGDWAVDERNLLYVAEDDPLDVYRAIARLVDERAEVFRAIGSSEIVLSPVGHKATALGCLMAAMEFNLPVLYVETLRYMTPADNVPAPGNLDMLHVWLSGDAYPAESNP